MKTMLVLRHGKSDWGDPGLPDHDRPLAARGERDAPRMGAALAALGIVPDSVVTSTAVRARDTARLAATAAGYDKKITETHTAYEATAETLLRLLRERPDDGDTLLLVGHNPGMEELIALLIAGAGAEIGVRMPTAALACLAFEIRDWHDLTPGSGALQWLLTPRIVAPLLGMGKRHR